MRKLERIHKNCSSVFVHLPDDEVILVHYFEAFLYFFLQIFLICKNIGRADVLIKKIQILCEQIVISLNVIQSNLNFRFLHIKSLL